MSELKPCPFCGKEASYCNGSGRATNLKTFWCNCQNEDCLLFLHPLTVDMWQSRPIEDELRAELEKRTAELHYANTACMEMKHELARRDEIITRLKLAGNNMYFTCSDDPYQTQNRVHEAWRALMKELE